MNRALAMSSAAILSTREIEVAGERIILDYRGVAYLPSWRTLIVSDLHLEKGSSIARRGVFVPPYDSQVTLQRLMVLIGCHDPQTVVCLGDSFHDNEGPDRLSMATQESMRSAMAGRDWIWIAGNHDDEGTGKLPGTDIHEMALGGLVLRHIPAAFAPGEIAGHLHPGARIVRRGRSIRRPCFATDGKRLLMPAFGAFTGNLNILDDACRSLFDPETFQVFMLGSRDIYPMPTRELRQG